MLVGALILSGAVNTAIVGANGVLSRMVEDGVLTTWFKKPQKKFGTSYRVINMIAGLQVLTIIASRGNVYLLASLYAFGVIWSFSFMSLAVLVLRYKLPEKREWKVPGNIRIRGVEIPIGLGIISAGAFLHGAGEPVHQGDGNHCRSEFQPGLFLVFTVSERVVAEQHATGESGLEQFNVAANTELNAEAMDVRPGNILVAVRDPHNLFYLRDVLSRVDTTRTDVVVMTARIYHREHSFSGSIEMESTKSSRSTSRSCLLRWFQRRRRKASTFRWWWCPPTISSKALLPPRSG